MARPKRKVQLERTLKELEKTLGEWDTIRVEKKQTDRNKESEVALKTHLLLLALKEQIHDLS